MEACWNRTTPHQRFWIRLQNQRVDQLVSDPERFLLRHMRHDHEMVKSHQKLLGHIFKERGLCLYKLIAEACGENWDSEDEQKNCPPMEQRPDNAISLDCPREERVREREVKGDVVQASDDRREEDVQARREVGLGLGRRRCPQEEAPRQKKKAAEGGGRGTVGLGNVEEGRLADGAKPKKKRVRKRPVLTGKGYANIN